MYWNRLLHCYMNKCNFQLLIASFFATGIPLLLFLSSRPRGWRVLINPIRLVAFILQTEPIDLWIPSQQNIICCNQGCGTVPCPSAPEHLRFLDLRPEPVRDTAWHGEEMLGHILSSSHYPLRCPQLHHAAGRGRCT